MSQTTPPPPRENFSGNWKLDLAASEPMASMLAAQGVSWMERKLADSVPVVQKITQSDTRLTIQVESKLAKSAQELPLDDAVDIRQSDRVGRMETTGNWEDDGKTLTTVTRFNTQDGQRAEWSIARHLEENGRTMVLVHTLRLQNGRSWTSRRILRKI